MTVYNKVNYTSVYGETPINATNRNTLENGLDAAKNEVNTWITPVGCMVWYPKYYTPTGWLYCNGQGVSTTTYANLFAVIGYTYGGSGGTFNVPDIRGYFVRGVDGGRGFDSGRTLGSTQAAQMLSHAHNFVNWVFNGANARNVEGMTGWDTSVRNMSTQTRTMDNYTGTEFRPKNVALIALIKY